MAFLLVFLIFAVIIGVIVGNYLRRKGQVFEGVIRDKDVQETVHDNTDQNGVSTGSSEVTHSYYIKVETSAGKTIRYSVSEGKYEQAAIGDRVSKRAGTTDVEIIKNIANTPAPPSADPPQPPAGIAN